MTADHKVKWQCEKCINKSHEKDKCSIENFSFVNVTQRNRSNQSGASAPPLSSMGADVSVDLVIEMRLLQAEMISVRAEMQEVRSVILSLTSAVGACNSRISDLATRMEAIESRQCQQVTNDVLALEGTITGLQSELNDRVQDMLCNDCISDSATIFLFC
ncbi:hypothetical protein EVAR_40699_1 [Eumeta japonica]|uniref:Uncharacterized protein n=1 Tax=Eumeta variegata TaxID=151549 RepID=A0A4C1XAB0_EUMVA|nr:hypothetical protein EVAR_40699_1 [Eumeta japonica]